MLSSERVTGAQVGQLSPNPRIDPALWDLFFGARDASEFCKTWLAVQCGMIQGVTTGLLLLDDGEGHFSTVAAWPDPRRDLSYLTHAAQQTLAQRRSVVQQPATNVAPNTTHIGQPIKVDERLKGVVVVDLLKTSGDVQAAVLQLRWGVGWLEALFRRQKTDEDSAKLGRFSFALEVLSESNENASLFACALAVANSLATRLNCRQVSIGFWSKNRIRLSAISHSAVFSGRAHVVSAIENAMEEAADQGATVAVPHSMKTERRISLAHEDLANLVGASSIASVVMKNGPKCLGVILLERDKADAFDDKTLELLETVAALVGPTFETKAELNKLVTGRIVQAVNSSSKALFGRGHYTFKIATVFMTGVLTYLALAQSEFRVAAKAVLEGAVQRAAVAPYDGYIATAPIRAGDVVDEGQTLATLDGRELKLEAARWKSEYEQQLLKYNDALAKRDRSAALIISTSLDQTQAQLSLVEDKLIRSNIISPFRGVVVSGDLSQMLGAPVEKGKVLFEVAPLASFRVMLQVDERDIAYIKDDQQGTLLLTGFASDSVPFSVKKITPVATASDGKNHFRVEAEVKESTLQLRPGMEGVAKVSVDRRSLLSIWTRSLLDWARIALWKWSP